MHIQADKQPLLRLPLLVIGAFLLILPLARGEEFVVSYWYGPPAEQTTIERYQQIKDANFNVVFPPGIPGHGSDRETNLQLLDICQQLELKAVIADPRMPRSISNEPDAKQRLDDIIADYSQHPALLAYYVIDEPSADQFPGLAEVVAYLKEKDPAHPGYINLFPTYAAPWAQLGTETYQQYVDDFVRLVDPFVISYDHYPFLTTGDRDDFFLNLAIIRNATINYRRPFWNIVQCVQHYDYRALGEGELRFQAMQTLAFGGKGLLWYTYWYPGPLNPTVQHAMIEHDGTNNPNYDIIAAINAEARAIGNELLHAESWATFHVGDAAQYPPPPQSPLTIDGEGRFTVGVFKHDEQTLALVTNRDYRAAAEAHLHLDVPVQQLERFDPAARKWLQVPDPPIALHLPPGGALLFRW